jgi:uncharacterized delta-60 repeat protein
LRLSGNINGSPITQQGTSGLATTWSGTIAADWDLDNRTIQFNSAGTALIAAQPSWTNYQPNRGGEPGSAPGNYGALAFFVYGGLGVNAEAAVRDLVASLDTPAPLPLTPTGLDPYTFASTQSLPIESGSADYHYSPEIGPYRGSVPLTELAAQNESPDRGVLQEEPAGKIDLMVPIKVTINRSIGPISASLTVTGQLTASTPFPFVDLSNGGVRNQYDFGAHFAVGHGPAHITDLAARVADAGTNPLTSMTVTLTNRPDGAQEVVAANLAGTGLNGSNDPATGTERITGNASPAVYQNVLRSTTYEDRAQHPSSVDRILHVVVSDGSHSSVARTSTVRFDIGDVLDSTFGITGKKTTDFFSGDDTAQGMAIQHDGKIVVAGSATISTGKELFAVARYNPLDGSLDTSFGPSHTGKVTTDFGGDTIANGVAIQSDGKIVVVGSTVTAQDRTDLAIARYDQYGYLDTSFGTSHTGMVTARFSGTFWLNEAAGICLQADGQIVVAGTGRTDQAHDGQFALARFNVGRTGFTDGTLDPTFHGTGTVFVPPGAGTHVGYATGVALQGDNIVEVGWADNATDSSDFAVLRFLPGGSLDTSFNGNGKVNTHFDWKFDRAYGVAIQGASIVVAGVSTDTSAANSAFALARYNSNGTPDTTFNHAGLVTTRILGAYDSASAVAIQSNGKIVAAGLSSTQMAVARYNPDGSPDTSFNGNGKVATDFGESAWADAVALQSDGKIVVAGAGHGGSTGYDFALARYDTATHFSVTGPTDVTAGQSIMVTVQALNDSNQVVRNYSGSVHFDNSIHDESFPPVLPGDGPLRNGVGTFNATLFRSGSSQWISATDTVLLSISGAQSSIAVSPSTATKFLVAGYPSPTTAGDTHSFTVTATDAYGNTVSRYTGTVHLSCSDPQAGLSPDAGLNNGFGTFAATLKTADTQMITATDIVQGSITGTQRDIVVNPAAARTLTVANYPSATTAGDTHSFTVTAEDFYGNTARGYTGSVRFNSSDWQAHLPDPTQLTNGFGSCTATLKTAADTQSITATDSITGSITGSQTGIAVSPAAAVSFVLRFPSPTTAGSLHGFPITAQDVYQNTATGYTGTIHLTSSDSRAIFSDDSTLTNGTGLFAGVLYTAGYQSITATDTVDGSITGTQGDIQVVARSLNHFSITTSVDGSAAVADTPFDVTVIAQDAYDNTYTNYQGTVTFSTTDGDPGVILPSNFTFQPSDGGKVTFSGGVTLITPGDQILTVTDTVSGITGSAMVTVTSSSGPLTNGIGSGNGSMTVASLSHTAGQAVKADAGTTVYSDAGETNRPELVWQPPSSRRPAARVTALDELFGASADPLTNGMADTTWWHA